MRESLLFIAVGCAFTLIESGARNEFPSLHTLVRNSILSVSIAILSRGLERQLVADFRRPEVAEALGRVTP